MSSRRRIAVVSSWAAVMLVLGYLVLFQRYSSATASIPCRTTTGLVWLFQPHASGTWVATPHRIGKPDKRNAVPDAAELTVLNCDPTVVREDELRGITNGVVEHVDLRKVGDSWELMVRDEMNGIYVTRYEVAAGGAVVVTRSTRQFLGLKGVGLLLFVMLGSLATLLRPRGNQQEDLPVTR